MFSQQGEQLIGCWLAIEWLDRAGNLLRIRHDVFLSRLARRRILVHRRHRHITDRQDMAQPEVAKDHLGFHNLHRAGLSHLGCSGHGRIGAVRAGDRG